MATKSIKLANLFVNTENYRFEPLNSQKEAIDKMVENQGDKLYNLASDIMENDLSPVDLIQVTPTDEKGYVVLEGNRRVTSLKLLNNPSLIGDEYSVLRKKFTKLQKEYTSKLINSIECVVFENPSEADIWIKRKHSGELNGIGTVTWNSQQKQRFEEKIEGKSSLPLQVISLLKSHESISEEFKNGLSNLNTSNLERLISDPYIREKLGIDINNGRLVSKVDVNEVVKGLTKVVLDILSPAFKVSKIYDRDKRREYIDGFSTNDKPDTLIEAESTWELQNYSPTSKESEKEESSKLHDDKKPSTKPLPLKRKSLIPKGCNLKIENPKINKIYNELKQIQITPCPNASAILFRVFLELSVDTYLEKYKIVNNSALTASASNESLQGKTSRVINHLKQKKVINDDVSIGLKAEMKDQNSILSIESLNGYVHNPFYYPKADNLLIGWDNIEKFMIILWEDINIEAI